MEAFTLELVTCEWCQAATFPDVRGFQRAGARQRRTPAKIPHFGGPTNGLEKREGFVPGHPVTMMTLSMNEIEVIATCKPINQITMPVFSLDDLQNTSRV